MAKYNLVPFLLRYTAIIAVFGYPLTSQVIAQQTPWDSVFQSFQEDEPPVSQSGGSRGQSWQPCALAPFTPRRDSDSPSTIWNHRPIFVWKGDIEKVELFAKTEGTVIWTQIVESEKNHISYTGEPLKSGETYKLSFYDVPKPEAGYAPVVDLEFQVVESKEYEQITQELNQLQTEHQQKQSTPEEIALARTQYFADRKLWSDAIMEWVLVENPPSSLKELLETKIPGHICRRSP